MRRLDECDATRHDTATAYKNHRCRCPEARRLGLRQMKLADYRRAKGIHGRQDFTPILGTQRRIRALMALGWPLHEQGRRVGRPMKNFLYTHRTQTTVVSAAQVAELYELLSMQQGPSARTRRLAAEAGFPPPLAWDNIDDPGERPQHSLARNRDRVPRGRMAEDIIEAAFDWRRPRMSYAEQRFIVDTALDERGMTVVDIALMLGLTACAVRQTRSRSNQARRAETLRQSKTEMRVAS